MLGRAKGESGSCGIIAAILLLHVISSTDLSSQWAALVSIRDSPKRALGMCCSSAFFECQMGLSCALATDTTGMLEQSPLLDGAQPEPRGEGLYTHLPINLRQRDTIIIGFFVTVFGLVVLRNAWLSDDINFTFRTIEHVLQGYGPVWNTTERVQTYTHPLWMLLLSLLHFFTHEFYYTTILLSVMLALGTVLLIAFKIAHSTGGALLAILLLTCSKAFIDYSTS